jgi:hypothetical protein
VFSRLEGLYDGVAGGVVVPGGMFVPGVIAAAHIAADQADAQMDPGVACFQAVFAALTAGRHRLNLIEMCALGAHVYLSVSRNQ